MFNFGNGTIMLKDGFEIVSFTDDYDFIVRDKDGNLYVCYVTVKETSPIFSTRVIGG